ncbi:MAG TPA: FxLYD domain-containing protein [Candidatus Paceibacterota bacterium]
MSWAERRRAFIIAIIIAMGVTLAALVFMAVWYQAPTCTDGVQNQDEAGVDCGGSCPYLCSAQAQQPTVRFVTALPGSGGRTDVIAYIDNPNANAAVQGAPYTVEVYGPEATVLARFSGTVDLPPRSTVPIFIPSVYQGDGSMRNSFLTFDSSSTRWFASTDVPPVLPVSDIQVVGTTTPRVTATLSNPTPNTLYNVKVVASVFDSSGNVIAASQTIVPRVGPQASADMTFMWDAPFTGVPAKEEIVPVLPIVHP